MGSPISQSQWSQLQELRNSFLSKRVKMEQERDLSYLLQTGDFRIWLYADIANSGDYIFCSSDKRDRGFGGSSLSFKLSHELGSISLIGPWHSNSDALYRATGIDIRDKHLTRVMIIAFDEAKLDVLVEETEPQIGAFHRGYEMAQKLRESLDKASAIKLYATCQTMGGSSSQVL